MDLFIKLDNHNKLNKMVSIPIVIVNYICELAGGNDKNCKI
jgi:hypothetical protein